MKIVTAGGKKIVKMTRQEWEQIGKKAQWVQEKKKKMAPRTPPGGNGGDGPDRPMGMALAPAGDPDTCPKCGKKGMQNYNECPDCHEPLSEKAKKPVKAPTVL